MDPLAFWRFKIVQFLHDPPGKPYALYYRPPKDDSGKKAKGGHAAFAKRLLEAFGATGWDAQMRPDRAATGADRPNVGLWQHAKVVWGHQHQDPVATHPLAGASLKLDGGKGERRSIMPRDSFKSQLASVETLRLQASEWEDPSALKQAFFMLWRRFREDLIGLNDPDGQAVWQTDPRTSLLWQHMPADTRTPDHTIWNHTRMTSALAFLEAGKGEPVPTEQEPWLFSFTLGPVQDFIAEARTSRDLWVNSMLLADLSWHAMLPVVEHYGPDAIVYPELNGNPMVDRWLMDHSESYPELFLHERDVRSWAALLPHHWIAILPRGGKGHLLDLETLARTCTEAVAKRWDTLSRKVRDRLSEASRAVGVDPAAWRHRWEQQHEEVVHATWAAVPWRHFPAPPAPKGGALPAQKREQPEEDTPEREKWLRPWVSDDIWGHYEEAREVYYKTQASFLTAERGFDYALVHHQLSLWHTMRKQARTYPRSAEGAAERCTICHHRAALEPDRTLRDLDSQRSAVRTFWTRLGRQLGEPAWGEERLCGVCAFRRLLVPFGEPGEKEDFNRVWVGTGRIPRRRGGALSQPFPSTAAVAAQRFLRCVVEEPELASAREAVARACGDADWSRTFFPRALPSLDGLASEPFLDYEPQVFFEQARQAELRRSGHEDDAAARRLDQAIGDLMGKVKQINVVRRERGRVEPIPLPGSRVALVALDGDGVGRLLLGAPTQIRLPWREVLHPDAVRQLREHAETREAGWTGLLERPRLAGPSLQAFLSRALGNFSHRIVPWVVEREFRGRLIYAGGDDVLAMVDVDDALPLCARLQQLYTSAWVLDTAPMRSPWEQRTGASAGFDPNRDRGRLVIPDTSEPVSLPLHRALAPVAAGWERNEPTPPKGGWTGELLAMPGPYQSLSAGVVYAHFKTPLGAMVRKAHDLLGAVAKQEKGRAAFAAAVYSRGGVKVQFGMHWASPGEPGRPAWPDHAARIDRVREAFATGRLPGRLPYKLREFAWALDTADEEEARTDLLNGLVRHALKGTTDEGEAEGVHGGLLEDVVTLWSEDPSVAGLLLCRALSREEEEEA